jgi:hypothetical protein
MQHLMKIRYYLILAIGVILITLSLIYFKVQILHFINNHYPYFLQYILIIMTGVNTFIQLDAKKRQGSQEAKVNLHKEISDKEFKHINTKINKYEIDHNDLYDIVMSINDRLIVIETDYKHLNKKQ